MPQRSTGMGALRRVWQRATRPISFFLVNYLNFFRIHMLYIVLTPFITSAIMYGSNTKDYHLPYIDCLFLCVSSITVTGLVSVPVSNLTLWQQIILFVHMCTGNLIVVSMTMVLVRRHLFRKRFDNLVKYDVRARKRVMDVEEKLRIERAEDLERIRGWFGMHHEKAVSGAPKKRQKLSASMVQRVDEPAVLVNPTGHQTTKIDEPSPELVPEAEPDPNAAGEDEHLPAPILVSRDENEPRGILNTGNDDDGNTGTGVRIMDAPMRESPPLLETNFQRSATVDGSNSRRERMRPFARSHTVSFSADTESPRAHPAPVQPTVTFQGSQSRMSMERSSTIGTQNTTSRPIHKDVHHILRRTKTKGLGGFPSPFEYIGLAIRAAPGLHSRVTVPHTATMASSRGGRTYTIDDSGARREAPYISFDAVVKGNSLFQNLTAAQRDELGGVEYRALNLLAWLIPIYWIAWISIAILLGAPYLATAGTKYREAIESQTPKPPHNTTWYWIFNSVSAMTNTGMSLYDDSMQGTMADAYLLLIPMATLILVGNTAFPIMLRLCIWVMSILVPKSTLMYETLCFLLDHPRRCFYYLFPAEQTWFLAFVIFALTSLDWMLIIVLDLNIGKTMDTGQWVLDGLFQSVATRSAGFQTFNTLKLAPAEQMLQVFMMYLAVFPLALAVRSTNVYEERSLGVVARKDDDDNDISVPGTTERKVWGKFLAAHARRQLAYDLWWLSLGVWIVCIAERNKIEDPSTQEYFNIFTVLYELTSAYGTVGLSTGSPNGTSLSGGFSVISKLVVIAVMFRGRHRGLPVAIDRAIMLPGEVHEHDAYHDTIDDQEPSEPAGHVMSNMYHLNGRADDGRSSPQPPPPSPPATPVSSPSDIESHDDHWAHAAGIQRAHSPASRSSVPF